MFLTVNNLSIRKPSLFSLFIIFFILIFFIFIGDTSWRHLDDYGPLESYFNAKNLKDYLRLFTYYGWGSYPPIWSYFTFITYLFKPLGIDAIRFVCFTFGFLSLTISSFLTYSICISLRKDDFSKIYKNKNFLTIELFSIIFNFLNPEIIMHANSNMPYNLSLITSQLTILLIIAITKKNNNLHFSNDYIYISYRKLIIFSIISILLTFQSLIIYTAFLITIFIYCLRNKKIYNIKNLNPVNIFSSSLNLFKNINYKYIRNLTIALLSFLFIQYFLKIFLLIIIGKQDPGSWAFGTKNIYNILIQGSNSLEILQQIIFNLKTIIVQSIYPFRKYQLEVSSVLFLFFIISFIWMALKNLTNSYLALYSIFLILTTISLSLKGSFVFTPTRHTIFLYPIFWIPIALILERYLFVIKNQTFYKIILINLYLTFSLGTFVSIKEISYSNLDNRNLIRLFKKADFYAHNSYQKFTNISMHGSQEYKLSLDKKCSINKIKNLKDYKIFMYSHRTPFVNDDKQIKFLITQNEECFQDNSKVKIIEKFEKPNFKDIEQNNLIYNGGSSLYSYLLEVSSLDKSN